MTNKLQSLINQKTHANAAVDTGTAMHTKLQNIFFLPDGIVGDADIVQKIADIPELCEYMGPLSKTEVPIAGIVNGNFISRRIDRLYVNKKTKMIVVLDYKTDVNRDMFLKKYIEQLTEYRDLLKQIYPDFNIKCKILWLHDFTLENII